MACTLGTVPVSFSYVISCHNYLMFLSAFFNNKGRSLSLPSTKIGQPINQFVKPNKLRRTTEKPDGESNKKN